MPIYAFACQACGHAFDNLQKMSDPDPATCPACGAAQVKRQLTAPSFRLAGAGWYETDFKKDGDRKRNIAGEGGESKPAEAPSPAADSQAKPEAAAKGAAAPVKDPGGAREAKKSDARAPGKSKSPPVPPTPVARE